MSINDPWMALDELRWVTERTGTLHPMQEKQLRFWPRAVYFQSVKSVFTWTPGERTDLTESRIDQTIQGLRDRGIIQSKAPAVRRKPQKRRGERGWRRRPEIKFDLTLDRAVAEPEGLDKRVAVFVDSLHRMLGDQVKIVLNFGDGQQKVF